MLRDHARNISAASCIKIHGNPQDLCWFDDESLAAQKQWHFDHLPRRRMAERIRRGEKKRTERRRKTVTSKLEVNPTAVSLQGHAIFEIMYCIDCEERTECLLCYEQIRKARESDVGGESLQCRKALQASKNTSTFEIHIHQLSLLEDCPLFQMAYFAYRAGTAAQISDWKASPPSHRLNVSSVLELALAKVTLLDKLMYLMKLTLVVLKLEYCQFGSCLLRVRRKFT